MSDILYTVNLWESNPNEGGDDCITGADYVLESEAIEAFNNPGKAFPWKGYANWQYIDLPMRWRGLLGRGGAEKEPQLRS